MGGGTLLLQTETRINFLAEGGIWCVLEF